MNANDASGPTLEQRFPKMRPLKKAPTLFTYNGVGTRMCGRRDHDPETNTYIATHCFCFLYIPLVALGAYRVADAEEGWYFLGKERLSRFAGTWNRVMVAVALWAVLQVGWTSYTSGDSYKIRKELKIAEEQLAKGEPLKAAGTYSKLSSPGTHLNDVRKGLETALTQCLGSDSAEMVAGAYRVIRRLPSELNQPAIVPDPFKRGEEHIEKFRRKDPESALTVYEAVAPFSANVALLVDLRVGLLKEAVAARPANTNRVIELAGIYEETRQVEAAKELLLPLKDSLGASEGARILGQCLLREGKNEEAYPLLYPYVQTRLERLHAVERAYTNAMAQASRRALDELREGKAGRDFYDRYKAADKETQDTMVNDYMRRVMQSDSALTRSGNELKQANRVVHVALDLGIVQLNRAQALNDPSARRAELEAAEKTLLAIGGLAGESDEYRLFLGQVYYWLGKSTQGKQLFDELLASTTRRFAMLIALSRTLRDVGEMAQARLMAEEAYKAAKTPEEKYVSAGARAYLQTDIEDQIAWLQKSDPSDTYVQIGLNNALGDRALANGDKAGAAQHLRKVVAAYQSLDLNNASTLNNYGLACLSLYEAGGNWDDYMRGISLLERAVELDPGNSVLLINTLNTLYRSAIMECVRDRLHLQAISQSADAGVLSHLYSNESDRDALYDKVSNNERMKKAVAYLDKALLLAPKRVSLYQSAIDIHSRARNLAELRRIGQRMQAAQLSFAEEGQEMREFQSGSKDKEMLPRLEAHIRRFEKLLENESVRQDAPLAGYVKWQVAYMLIVQWIYGADSDSQRALALAREAYEANPCAATESGYEMALFHRAHFDLMKHPEYAAVAERCRRSLPASYLVPLMLGKGGALAEAIRSNENVQAAVALEKQHAKRFPHRPDSADWAMLRAFDPELAAGMAREMQKDEVLRLESELELATHPYSGYVVLDSYYLELALGNAAKANAIYRAAKERGVMLPEL